ncbi:hypothetical protein B0H19DRAFT_1376295 [Mycena capillaripes]|nr:hypothetical protein B0H19DRAFT_1376295 [Mycena capillaripes]
MQESTGTIYQDAVTLQVWTLEILPQARYLSLGPPQHLKALIKSAQISNRFIKPREFVYFLGTPPHLAHRPSNPSPIEINFTFTAKAQIEGQVGSTREIFSPLWARIRPALVTPDPHSHSLETIDHPTSSLRCTDRTYVGCQGVFQDSRCTDLKEFANCPSTRSLGKPDDNTTYTTFSHQIHHCLNEGPIASGKFN